MKQKTNTAILLAVLAAALYAVSTPVSKMLLAAVPPTMVAAFLYLGAGIGMDSMMVGRRISRRNSGSDGKTCPSPWRWWHSTLRHPY